MSSLEFCFAFSVQSNWGVLAGVCFEFIELSDWGVLAWISLFNANSNRSCVQYS